jgi:hypothetical protein
MTYENLVTLTIEVRKLQKEYFKTRSPRVLDACKAKELALDKQLGKAMEAIQQAKQLQP